MRIKALFAAALLSALPARALDVGKAPPEEFLSRSRTEPGRLYALIIGATWCRACKALSASLTELSASSSTAIGRAAWDKVETDEYGTAKFSELLSSLTVAEPNSLPSVLVLRDGDGLGLSMAGNDLPKIEAFLAEAERQPPRYSRKPANSSMRCPGRKDWATYTLGVSGYGGAGAATDDFGRKILLSFVGPDSRERRRLFAPPRSKSTPGTESAHAEDAVFFSASDPLAARASLLEDVSGSSGPLAALASAPGRDLRLILTGHSGEDGMTIGFQTTAWFADDPKNTYEKNVLVSPQDVAGAVRRAARSGKEVRGLVTTCFAGRYGDAFMPGAGSAAAPTCAAFATLPDKPADGCYSNGYALGVDYASKLLARRTCGTSEDGRALHYAVAATTSGRDVPMLSSEYFLLYGPGAEFLGRGDRAPAPPLSVQRYDMGSGVRAYVDVISNQVLRAYQGDDRIDPPRLALLDCVGDDYSHSKLDRQNLSSFYLRPHKEGALVSECTPLVKLYWESDVASPRPSTSVFLDPDWNGWRPDDDWKEFRKDFGAAGPTITLEGMRPAARVLLTSVIPAFADKGASRDLGERLHRIVEELRPYDEPLAEALRALMAAQAGGVARFKAAEEKVEREPKSVDHLNGIDLHPVARPAPPEEDMLIDIPGYIPMISSATVRALEPSELRAVLLASDLSAHSPPPAVDASALIAAMLDNLSPSKYEFGSALPRLAHAAAAAQAELALIEEAKTSPEARRLFAQLERIKTCERGLY